MYMYNADYLVKHIFLQEEEKLVLFFNGVHACKQYS